MMIRADAGFASLVTFCYWTARPDAHWSSMAFTTILRNSLFIALIFRLKMKMVFILYVGKHTCMHNIIFLSDIQITDPFCVFRNILIAIVNDNNNTLAIKWASFLFLRLKLFWMVEITMMVNTDILLLALLKQKKYLLDHAVDVDDGLSYELRNALGIMHLIFWC